MTLTQLINKFVSLKTSRDNNELYYYFIETSLNKVHELCNNLDAEELNIAIHGNSIFFRNDLSKKKFCNCIKRINDDILHILQLCYKGDIIAAELLLCKLFGEHNSKLKRYFVEPYINYFTFNMVKDMVFYRMRDTKFNESVNDCWHIPFELRYKVHLARYSMAGIPTLYLGDSKETSDKELNKLKSNNKRWVSEFRVKDSTAIPLLDLSYPTISEIANMSEYEKLAFIITFPIRLACSIKTIETNNNFNEEYFLPQLIFHALFYGKRKNVFCNYIGVVYSSTKNPMGKNIAIPATYDDINPPKKGHSNKLKMLFEEPTQPEVFTENMNKQTDNH